MPNCSSPKCPDKAVQDGNFCPAHTCSEKECLDERSIGRWCQTHKPCRFGNCSRPCVLLAAPVRGSDRHDYCTERKLHSTICTPLPKSWLTVLDISRQCGAVACQVRIPGWSRHKYCHCHGCRERDCEEMAMENAEYCQNRTFPMSAL
jgi:hypothetical protein